MHKNTTNPEADDFQPPRWMEIQAIECAIEGDLESLHDKMDLEEIEHASRLILLHGCFHQVTLAKALNKYENGRTPLKPKEVEALIWCIIVHKISDTTNIHLLNKGFQICDAHFKRVTAAGSGKGSLVKTEMSINFLLDQLSAWHREVLGCDIEEWQHAARVEFGHPKVEQVDRQDSHNRKPAL